MQFERSLTKKSPDDAGTVYSTTAWRRTKRTLATDLE